MIWKSAPKAQTLPLTPSPFTSPPVIGMIRRTPVPISPAEVTSPIRTVMVKTYLVSSWGVVIGHLYSVVTVPQLPHGEEREARLRTMLRIAGRTMWHRPWPASFETPALRAPQDEELRLIRPSVAAATAPASE